MARQLLLSLPHEPRPVEWPPPRSPKWKQGRLGVITWWGPLGAEHHFSRTVWMMEVLRTANRLLRAYEIRKGGE